MIKKFREVQLGLGYHGCLMDIIKVIRTELRGYAMLQNARAASSQLSSSRLQLVLYCTRIVLITHIDSSRLRPPPSSVLGLTTYCTTSVGPNSEQRAATELNPKPIMQSVAL